jgi:hypothetical protein
VVLQVAEGRSVAFTFGKEVLINAQFLRTWLPAHFSGLQPEVLLEPSLYSRRANPLTFGQPLTADPIEVLPEDLLTERLGAPKPGKNPRKALIEIPPAAQAMKLQCLKVQVTVPHSPTLMA